MTTVLLHTYIHAGGKIGVVVALETDSDSDAVKECGKNVAMQVAALNPKYVDRSEVPADFIESMKKKS